MKAFRKFTGRPLISPSQIRLAEKKMSKRKFREIAKIFFKFC